MNKNNAIIMRKVWSFLIIMIVVIVLRKWGIITRIRRKRGEGGNRGIRRSRLMDWFWGSSRRLTYPMPNMSSWSSRISSRRITSNSTSPRTSWTNMTTTSLGTESTRWFRTNYTRWSHPDKWDLSTNSLWTVKSRQ